MSSISPRICTLMASPTHTHTHQKLSSLVWRSRHLRPRRNCILSKRPRAYTLRAMNRVYYWRAVRVCNICSSLNDRSHNIRRGGSWRVHMMQSAAEKPSRNICMRFRRCPPCGTTRKVKAESKAHTFINVEFCKNKGSRR